MPRPAAIITRLLDAAYRPLADPADDDRQRLRKSIMMVAFVAGVVISILSAVGTLVVGQTPSAFVLFGYAGLLASGLLVARRYPRALTAVLVVLLGTNLIMSAGLSLLGGGVAATGGNVVWGIIAPVLMLLMYGRRTAIYWFAAYLVALGVGIYGPAAAPPEDSPRPASFAISLTGVSVFVFGMFVYFVGQRDKAQAIAERERARSDALLRNILPDEIAGLLKTRPGTIADHYDAASVLFADIADFTPLSTGLPAADLVALLNEVFSEFDHLVDRYGVEKIKTIGDCYMVAAGVPVARADHADVLASLALDMQTLVAARPFGGRRLQFRMGIHSGPLVAGVIGERKFIYDLWGDTVNTASRMESHGVAGAIQVTRDTRLLLDERFRFTDRGVVAVKGKGDLHVYLLEGRA